LLAYVRYYWITLAHSPLFYIQKWGFGGLRVAKILKSHLLKLDIYLTF